MDRVELKNQAKNQIKGNLGSLLLCCLVIMAVAASVIGGLLAPALLIGLITVYFGLTRGEKPKVATVFSKVDLFGRALWLNVLVFFFTFLWTLLLVVPGIIKGISYSLATFILADCPELTAREALNESKRITKGRIGEIFVMVLSFYGWFLLCVVTLGFAAIYVGPYFLATMANYYNKIKDHDVISEHSAFPARGVLPTYGGLYQGQGSYPAYGGKSPPQGGAYQAQGGVYPSHGHAPAQAPIPAPAQAQAPIPGTPQANAAGWTPTNPQLFSNMPLSALLRVFIFTNGDGNTVLYCPVATGILADTAGAHPSALYGKVSFDIIAKSDVGVQIEQTSQFPASAWTAMEHIAPDDAKKAQMGKYRSCVRTFRNPSTQESGALVLLYQQ